MKSSILSRRSSLALALVSVLSLTAVVYAVGGGSASVTGSWSVDSSHPTSTVLRASPPLAGPTAIMVKNDGPGAVTVTVTLADRQGNRIYKETLVPPHNVLVLVYGHVSGADISLVDGDGASGSVTIGF